MFITFDIIVYIYIYTELKPTGLPLVIIACGKNLSPLLTLTYFKVIMFIISSITSKCSLSPCKCVSARINAQLIRGVLGCLSQVLIILVLNSV